MDGPTFKPNISTLVFTEDISTETYFKSYTTPKSAISTNIARPDSNIPEFTSHTSSSLVNSTLQANQTMVSGPCDNCSTKSKERTPKLENCLCPCSVLGDGVIDLEKRLQ